MHGKLSVTSTHSIKINFLKVSQLCIFLSLILSCKNYIGDKVLGSEDANVITNGRQDREEADSFQKTCIGDSTALEEKFGEWEQHLIKNKIFDYVTLTDCSNMDKMLVLYEQGKYPMHTFSKEIVPFALNRQSLNAYIVNYEMSSCVQGSTSANDIIIFSRGPDGKLTFDINLTNALKSEFVDYVTAKAGKHIHVCKKNDYFYTKGLRVENVIGDIIYGTFEIQGKGANCCPEFSGRFKFKISDYAFKVIEEIRHDPIN